LVVFGRVAKTAVGTKTGRRASRKAIKAAVGTRTGRKALKTGAKVAAKSGRGVVATRAGRMALRSGAKGAAKAGKGVGKAKLARSKQSRTPYVRYGLFALAGFALGALLGRTRTEAEPSYTGTTGPHSPSVDSPAGQRGETWGTGTPLGNAGGGGQSQQTPLVGEEPRPQADIGTEEQREVEQRVRTRIGEDPRTQDMPRVNVLVNDGVAELRGVAPSEEVKQAAGEIAAQTEGVREVRNLLTIG
jgi:hypothetical protein